MTEMELLELLRDIPQGYIRQADAFRQGHLRILKKQRPGAAVRKILSTAAMLVLILGAGFLGFHNRLTKAPGNLTDQAILSTQDRQKTQPDTEEWQRMVLWEDLSFYDLDTGNTTNLSQFCQDLTRRNGLAETPKPSHYTCLDLDGDGQTELVVAFTGWGDPPHLVLGDFDGKLCAVAYDTPQMDRLKADGVFYHAGIRSWAKLYRTGGEWAVQTLEEDHSHAPDAIWTQWVSAGTEAEPEAAANTEKVTPELLMRQAHSDLTFWKDGAEVSVPANLFIGDGYSLYIPQEGWVYEQIDYHGIPADRWVCTGAAGDGLGQNSTAEPTQLTILFRPGTDYQDIWDWVIAVNPQWNMVQNARGSLYADTATVNFFPAETGFIVCILETPRFGTEGLGILGAMWQSFNGWPSTLTGFRHRDPEASFTLTRYLDDQQQWEEYTVETQLYRAKGYSTYIPKEGFESEDILYGGLPAIRWVCQENREVWFAVVKLDTQDFDQAIQWGFSAGGSDYGLYEDASGGVSGSSTDGSAYLSMQFHKSYNSSIYAAIRHYPLAQTDNLGGYVKLMTDQFQTE